MNERDSSDVGFTLLEVVIAMVIFGIIASSTAVVLVRAVGGSSDNRARAAAANIAASNMDQLRRGAASAKGYTDLVSRQLAPVTVQGRTYSVTASVSVVTKAGTGSPCAAGKLSDEVYKKVGVAVTWPAAGSVKPVRSDTIIQNPGAASDPTTGALGVVVTGPAGPESGVPVNLGSGQTQLTDGSGCAYFTGLAAGTYTATASAPGHVDQNGAATASQASGVTAGNVALLNLTYAAASTPRITFVVTRADGSTVPSAVWLGTPAYTLKNNSTDRSGNAAGSSVTPVLYPYTSGYDVWLGGCAAEAPSPRVNFVTRPGSSPQVDVPVGGLTLTNTGLTSAEVVLQHADPSCPTTYTGTLPPGFAVTVALPFGQWSATTRAGSPTSPSSIVLTPGSPTSSVTFS